MSQIQKFGDGTLLPDIEKLTGDVGGAVGADAAFNINLLGGTGITTTGNPGANTITIASTTAAFTWTRTAAVLQATAANNGYIPTGAGGTEFTLPAVSIVGDIIEVCGEGSGKWYFTLAAGQTIRIGTTATTTGVGGFLEAYDQYDCVRLLCRVANTDWSIISSIGNLIFY